jgi:hypothetical protein
MVQFIPRFSEEKKNEIHVSFLRLCYIVVGTCDLAISY